MQGGAHIFTHPIGTPPPGRKRLKLVANSKAVCPVVATPFNLFHSVVRLGGVTQEDVLLDLGCGEGELLSYAAQHCRCRCVGLDVRHECLAATLDAASDAGVAHRGAAERTSSGAAAQVCPPSSDTSTA